MASLPAREQEAVVLHYFGGSASVEIAAFLDIPESTVRTRLHRARQRLQKELTEMDTQDFKALYEAARQQHRANKPVAAALERARAALKARWEQGELDFETVSLGERLLWRLGESHERLALFEAFLAQTTDPTQRYWAQRERVGALEEDGQGAAAVAAHKALLAQVPVLQGVVALDHGGAPAAPGAPRMPADTVLLDALLRCHVHQSWKAAGRLDEYLGLLRQALDTVPKHAENRWLRFYLLRWYLLILERDAGRGDEAQAGLVEIEALADEESHPFDAAHWRAHAACQRRSVDAVEYLEEAQRHLPQDDAFRTEKFLILRNNIGSMLTDAGHTALAEPLMRADCASPVANGYSFGRLAACVWANTGDRKATLALIRQGQAMEPREDFWPWLKNLPAFQSVAHDPALQQAATRPVL